MQPITKQCNKSNAFPMLLSEDIMNTANTFQGRPFVFFNWLLGGILLILFLAFAASVAVTVLPNTPSFNTMRYEVALAIAPAGTLKRVAELEEQNRVLAVELEKAKTLSGSLNNVVINPLKESIEAASSKLKGLWDQVVE